MILLLFSLFLGGWFVLGPPISSCASVDVRDLRPDQWSGGVGIGFLGDTPDGVMEFAFNGHADYFVLERFSIGPLAQYAGVGNDFLFGCRFRVGIGGTSRGWTARRNLYFNVDSALSGPASRTPTAESQTHTDPF